MKSDPPPPPPHRGSVNESMFGTGGAVEDVAGVSKRSTCSGQGRNYAGGMGRGGALFRTWEILEILMGFWHAKKSNAFSGLPVPGNPLFFRT